MIFSNQIALITPELFLSGTALLLLMVGVFQKEDHYRSIFRLATVILLLICWMVLDLYVKLADSYTIMGGMFIIDGFGSFMKVVVLIAASLTLYMSFEVCRNKKTGNTACFEFPILILLSVVGMMVMISANSLISLYMGVELQSLCLYVLTAINRDNEKSSEAGLKYFMLGALSSGILLYGCSLIYGFTGTVNFTEIATVISSGNSSMGLLLGMILVFTGLCFKVSAVPFHMWTPDVYEGAAKCVTAFFATAPKIAAIALFTRFAIQPFGGMLVDWQQIVIFVSVASMVVGAFGALKQINIKRLMAYSSIGHVGFILVGLAAGTESGVRSVLIYITIYALMNIGVFACIILMKYKGEHLENIYDLSGLAKYNPLYAAVMAILMLSMAGIPPMAGFLGKFFIFQAALEAKLYALAVIGVLASVVSAFYYIRIIKIMYFDAIETNGVPLDKEMTSGMKVILAGTAIFNLLFFALPTPLFEAAKMAAATLF